MQQSTVFWVSEKPLVRLCVCGCVCEKELCLVKNAHRVQKWNSGLWVRLTSGKCLGVARHHHRFHHRPNHQLRHRVNKRAYSSYIRNAIPLYVNILHWNLCVRLCQTLGSWDQRCSQYLSLFLLFRTARRAPSFHYWDLAIQFWPLSIFPNRILITNVNVFLGMWINLKD